MKQEIYSTNTREYTNIRSCSGKLVFDSSRLQERIFVYTLENCTRNLTKMKLNNQISMILSGVVENVA